MDYDIPSPSQTFVIQTSDLQDQEIKTKTKKHGVYEALQWYLSFLLDLWITINNGLNIIILPY